jgi:uncharacterized protein YdeI (YjbR/CyaY-like superfamily)
MIETDKFKKVEITSEAALRKWLLLHHEQQKSVWLVTYKKQEQDKYVSRWQVLDQLICFGWIDGIRRKLDHNRTMQLISPRKVEHWARSYKERAARLEEEGKMHASGLQSIESAKASGLWDFMEEVDNLIIPPDLATALSLQNGASVFFASINDSSKRFVLRWIKLAKTEKTRKNRILKIATLSALGEKLPGS